MPGRKTLLTLAGTLLTLWVVPLLTRQVQDRASVRDLKAGLAQEMTSSFADFDSVAVLRAYDLVQRNLSGDVMFAKDGSIREPEPRKILDRAQFNAGYRKWQRESNTVRAQLTSFFPDEDSVVGAWASFAVAAANFYFLTENTRDGKTVSGRVSALQTSLDRLNGWADFLDTDQLVTLSDDEVAALRRGQTQRDEVNRFFSAYDSVSIKFILAQEKIVERMLDAHAEGFSTRPCDFFSTFLTLEAGRLCIERI
jgi:hypothetical protein